jgi:hypothetical protein
MALLLFLLAGCGGSRTAPPAPPTTTATTTGTVPVSPASITLTVFRVRGGILRPEVVRIPRTRAVAAAALSALGLPAPVTIAHGTASVRRATATEAQAAEIVFTLTQFPSVRRVDVAGRSGLTRSSFRRYVPPVLVETPRATAGVGTTFHVSGTASVFEATLVVQLVRDDTVLVRRTVTASEGAPGRGSFDSTFHATPGALTIQVFAPSAVDGSPQHEVAVPVTVIP